MSYLHIFNGDSLAEAIGEKLDGTHMVWREALCQGPITYKIGEMGALDRREQFFVSQYGEEAKESYREFRHVISWLVDREYLSQFEEVILWFGQDYFCQFNMLAPVEPLVSGGDYLEEYFSRFHGVPSRAWACYLFG